MTEYAGRQPIIFRAPSSTLDAKAQADLAAGFATQANIAAQAAVAAADGRIYPDYATGNADTTAEQYFFVATSTAYDLYVHGTATAVVKLPIVNVSTGNMKLGLADGLARLNVASVSFGAAPIAGTIDDGVAAFLTNVDPLYGLSIGITGLGSVWLQAQRSDGSGTLYPIRLNPLGGEVQFGGSLIPVFDNTLDIGWASGRINEIYLGNNPIVTSDRNAKTDIGSIPDEWLDAWADVEWSRFKFVDGTRWHVGLVAQQVHEAFAAHGIDAFEIGICCFDEWEATEDAPAGSAWGLRYAECEAMEAAYQRREIARLKAQVAAL